MGAQDQNSGQTEELIFDHMEVIALILGNKMLNCFVHFMVQLVCLTGLWKILISKDETNLYRTIMIDKYCTRFTCKEKLKEKRKKEL